MKEFIMGNQLVLTLLLVLFFIGLGVLLIGSLMATLVALGNKRWLWGLLSLLLGPFVSGPYCVIHKEADYPRSLMFKGVVFMILSALLIAVLWFYAQA